MNIAMWIPICVLWIWMVGVGALLSHPYVAKVLRNLEIKLILGCARLQSGAYPSINECLLTCFDGCTGVSFQNGGCYHHKKCTTPTATPCVPEASSNATYVILEKAAPCLNDGRWDDLLDTCQCSGGFVGLSCERYASSCQELTEFGYAFGVHDVTLQVKPSATPFRTRCHLVSGSRQDTFMFSSSGYLRPRCRPWEQYDSGFFQDTSNFWIGLDNMKMLNDKGSNLVVLETRVGGASYGYRYENFTLTYNFFSYSFNFIKALKVNPSLSYGDCLGPVRGTQFSSFNMDYDQDLTHSCASVDGAAWWWASCTARCNPLGSWSDRKMDGFNTKDGRDYVIVMYFTSI